MGSNKRVDIKDDLRLFAVQVSWLAQQMESATLVDVVQLICTQLRESDDATSTGSLAAFLLEILRLDAEEQIEAEKALISLMSRSYQSERLRTKWTDIPDRNVDWTATYTKTLTPRPTRFVSRVVERKPDQELMGALRYQACQWRDILRASDAERHQKRALALDKAQASMKSPTSCVVPLNSVRLNRLQQHGPEARQAVETIRRVYALQHSPVSHLADVLMQGVENTRNTWWKRHDKRRSTALPALLEFSVLTAIAQTAANSEDWHLKRITLSEKFEALFEHTSLPLTLSLNKSAPCRDAFTDLRDEIGLTKHRSAQDSQPDICLTFENTESGATVSVLGDAKRNGDSEDQGASYFRDSLRTATYYLAAYGEALRASYQDNRPVGAIRPSFTLFFRQGVEHAKVNNLTDAEGCGNLPPVMAFDIEHHFDLSTSSTRGERPTAWHSEYLEWWLETLTRQVERKLGATLRSAA